MEPDDYARFPSWQDDARLRKWNLWGYVDARDVAAAVRGALEADTTGAEVCIVAAGDTVMTRDSADLMAEVFPDVPLRRAVRGRETLLASTTRATCSATARPRLAGRAGRGRHGTVTASRAHRPWLAPELTALHRLPMHSRAAHRPGRARRDVAVPLLARRTPSPAEPATKIGSSGCTCSPVLALLPAPTATANSAAHTTHTASERTSSGPVGWSTPPLCSSVTATCAPLGTARSRRTGGHPPPPRKRPAGRGVSPSITHAS